MFKGMDRATIRFRVRIRISSRVRVRVMNKDRVRGRVRAILRNNVMVASGLILGIYLCLVLHLGLWFG